ncbi:MAG TPA: hypothetical protein VH044_19170 [Polyangiaceae bacterium]|jgi:hypothetical protein|nr:hypothetical protein [Polyangiaceae bacterium]
MAKDRVVDIKPQAAQATRERDLVIRVVRDELIQFMARKFMKERHRDLGQLGPDVSCMVESLAEAMAVLHVDLLRSLAAGDTGAYERKVELAREMDQKK